MIISNNCEVNFRRYNLINSLLGFHSKLYRSGFNESENVVNSLTINSILVNIDIISGTYVNGFTSSKSWIAITLGIENEKVHPHDLLLKRGRVRRLVLPDFPIFSFIKHTMLHIHARVRVQKAAANQRF